MVSLSPQAPVVLANNQAEQYTNPSAYHDNRPPYPDQMIRYIFSCLGNIQRKNAVDLASGTGKLSFDIEPFIREGGASLRAIEMGPSMAREFQDRCAAKKIDIPIAIGTAEATGLQDDSVDILFTGTARHRFIPKDTLKESERVVRAGGVMVDIWNQPDPKCPWIDKIRKILDKIPKNHDSVDWKSCYEASKFTLPERHHTTYRYTLSKTVDDICKIFLTFSGADRFTDQEKATFIKDVEAIFNEDKGTYGRTDINIPYVTEVYIYKKLTPQELEARNIKRKQVSENRVRFLETKLNGINAQVDLTSQNTVAMTAITVASLFIFAPIALVGGFLTIYSVGKNQHSLKERKELELQLEAEKKLFATHPEHLDDGGRTKNFIEKYIADKKAEEEEEQRLAQEKYQAEHFSDTDGGYPDLHELGCSTVCFADGTCFTNCGDSNGLCEVSS